MCFSSTFNGNLVVWDCARVPSSIGVDLSTNFKGDRVMLKLWLAGYFEAGGYVDSDRGLQWMSTELETDAS